MQVQVPVGEHVKEEIRKGSFTFFLTVAMNFATKGSKMKKEQLRFVIKVTAILDQKMFKKLVLLAHMYWKFGQGFRGS